MPIFASWTARGLGSSWREFSWPNFRLHGGNWPWRWHAGERQYVLWQMSGWPGKSQNDLSAVQQYLRLQRDFPEGSGSVSKGKLIWRQTLRPTAISGPYGVRVVLAPSSSPKVFVENPILSDLAGERKLPHVYKQKPAQLCLYRPAYQEWTPSMFLSDTIIPWACLWLFYFEDWLITDEWKGGGEHPAVRDE